MTAATLGNAKATADDLFRQKRITAFAVPALVLAYLTYVFFAFDVPGLAKRASMDNAVILA